jgi:hypothetical protein
MVIGASDFVIARAQPNAIASRVFSYHCSTRAAEGNCRQRRKPTLRNSNDRKRLLVYSRLKGACKPRAKENFLSYVATKLPGVPATHDKEKSNGNGSLSVREIRLERLDRLDRFYSGVLSIALIR